MHAAGAPLVLVNAWDVASARIIEAAGARAIATTSAGVAWSLGAPDGDALDRELAIGLVARLAPAVSVPVTADIESGFGETPAQVADTVRAVLTAGAVGVNIEDAAPGGGALRQVDDQCARLAAARVAADGAGVPLYVNARIDTFLSGAGEATDTVARATAYLEAGADGVFVPGVSDPDTIKTLVAKIPAPVNILAGPGSPSIAELASLGVARVSLGSAVAESAYAVARRVAEEAFDRGTYESLAGLPGFAAVNALMSR
jgi:2-methylisocitrate lyase-like PEP mutase family enzyme